MLIIATCIDDTEDGLESILGTVLALVVQFLLPVMGSSMQKQSAPATLLSGLVNCIAFVVH